MWFPTAEQIVKLHDEIVREGGGSEGVLNPGPIEAAVARARWGPFRHGDIAERGAFLVRGIAVDHPFVDGNKRTAHEVVEVFLLENGFEIDVDERSLVEQMVAIAKGKRTLAEIRAWIRTNLSEL